MTKIMAQIFLILILFFNLTLKAQIIDESLSSYPPIILNLMKMFPRWSPELSTSQACAEALKQTVLDPDQCRASKKLNFFESFKSKLFFDFDAIGKYGFKKIDFDIQPDLKIRGLLGLHEGKNRPLVIFRMGIHGNRDEFMAERFLIKILFEDLGCHVLMLESLTSHGFIRQNNEISVGGLEEGLHTFYILNLIQQKKLSWVNQIKSLHLVGLSMGGEGVFLTTYLDEKVHQQLSSVVNLCPVVNLKDNFDRMNLSGWQNTFADLWNSQRLYAIMDKDESLKHINLWPMIMNQSPRFTKTVFSWLNKKRNAPLFSIAKFEEQYPEVKIPLPLQTHIIQNKNLFDLNNFWPVFENTKTPIQIISTKNDKIVLNELNTEKIRSGQQAGVFKKVSFVDLKGYHCSLAEEYEWAFLVELMKRGLRL